MLLSQEGKTLMEDDITFLEDLSVNNNFNLSITPSFGFLYQFSEQNSFMTSYHFSNALIGSQYINEGVSGKKNHQWMFGLSRKF